EQRNKQLRLFAEQSYTDTNLLDSFNEQLVKYGEPVFEKRKQFLQSFIPVFRKYYQQISSSDEEVDIIYQSHLLDKSFASLLHENSQNDLAVQRTLKGIHKDELEMMIERFP